MWFGTNDGLNRYDGYTFQVFKPDQSKTYAINSNLIQALEDQNTDVRYLAANALIQLEDPSALPALKARIASEQDQNVKLTLQLAIETLEER